MMKRLSSEIDVYNFI